ncbi:MAG: Spy/CpxP family protein refolding chaperone [Gemmatimonadota bacterium]|jgi:Spy/CpxP family protein refolding chaperone
MRFGGWWVPMVVAALCLPASSLEAQRRAPGVERGPGSVDRAAEAALRRGDELALTEAQRTALDVLRGEALVEQERLEREALALRQELRALRRSELAGPETTREEVQAFREEARARMEALRTRRHQAVIPLQERLEEILTTEQRLELRELQRNQRRRDGRHGMRGGRRGGQDRPGPRRRGA